MPMWTPPLNRPDRTVRLRELTLRAADNWRELTTDFVSHALWAFYVAPKLNVTLSQHTSPTSSSPMLGECYSNVATTSNQPSILPSDVYRKLCSRVKRQEIQSSSVAGRVTNCGDWRFGAGNETFN